MDAGRFGGKRAGGIAAWELNLGELRAFLNMTNVVGTNVVGWSLQWERGENG